MTAVAKPTYEFNDVLLLQLAREIAMEIRPLEEILKNHRVTEGEWEKISKLERFQSYLQQNVESWNSAVNTEERVKLKSISFVEEALPEFFARAHDPEESLNAKVEVLKTVAKFAGVGANVDASIGGERLSVTINLGEDRQLKIEKNVTPQVIEGEASYD